MERCHYFYLKNTNYIEKVIGNQVFNIRQDGSDFYVQASGSYVNKSKYIVNS